MFERRGIRLEGLAPLVNGAVPPHRRVAGGWSLDEGGLVRLRMAEGDPARVTVSAEGVDRPLLSLGLRFGAVTGVGRYLRNGYQSWDGSYFAAAGTIASDEPRGKEPDVGFAMTALLPAGGEGALVLGFERHDRFQTRFRFGGTAGTMTIDAETLLDGTGSGEGETLLLFDGDGVEAQLRRWSGLLGSSSPLPPRVPKGRITGWCSWYNLYAAINEPAILEHLSAAAAYRDTHNVPLHIFQIDDGFTPEMGDWLDVKAQFPRGMVPLLADIAAAGFTPGLWIAPFMVGNRSRLFVEHPDWVVRRRDTGAPLAHMCFYGEFRWGKRSEEYYVLDITHPHAAQYIRRVFRTWMQDWGCRYFKADFLFMGAEYGPDEAVWHEPGLSRIAIWRRMMTIFREEIGDATLLGCGCPLWASVGLVDAVRIGRDIGVSWEGEYSAESLLRDQLTRNHGSGILWQADPDCILLRGRFHHLSDDQVRSLALFAGLAGGVLMTSDKLDDVPADRAELFAALLREERLGCSFPDLAAASGRPIDQRAVRPDGTAVLNRFNVGSAIVVTVAGTLGAFQSRLVVADGDPLARWAQPSSASRTAQPG